jgi:hypothetical protein
MKFTTDTVDGTHTVQEVVAGSPAAHADVIVGSMLATINDQTVVGVSHEKVVEYLHAAKGGPICIAFTSGTTAHDAEVAPSSSSGTLSVAAKTAPKRVIRISKPPDQSWGMVLRGTDGGLYQEVKEVKAGGAAAECGLMAGDEVLAINGKSLVGVPHNDMVSRLKAAGNDLELTLQQELLAAGRVGGGGGRGGQHQQPCAPPLPKATGVDGGVHAVWAPTLAELQANGKVDEHGKLRKGACARLIGRSDGVLTKVVLPEGVTSIDEFSFQGWSGLHEVRLPDTMTDIDEYTFYQCRSLRAVHLPNTLVAIGTVRVLRISLHLLWLFVFRQKATLEDAIGSHAYSLEANTRVTNGTPLGCPLLLPVGTVNCVQTLKAGVLSKSAAVCMRLHSPTRWLPSVIVLLYIASACERWYGARFRQKFTLEDAIGHSDRWHSSRKSTFLTSSHYKLRPNTEGLHWPNCCWGGCLQRMLAAAGHYIRR